MIELDTILYPYIDRAEDDALDRHVQETESREEKPDWVLLSGEINIVSLKESPAFLGFPPG